MKQTRISKPAIFTFDDGTVVSITVDELKQLQCDNGLSDDDTYIASCDNYIELYPHFAEQFTGIFTFLSNINFLNDSSSLMTCYFD